MFDPHYAISVGIPIAQAAYDAQHGIPAMPPGFAAIALIQPDQASAKRHPVTEAMIKHNNIFGLVGRYGSTVFVGFRGTETPEEFLEDFTVLPAADEHFGYVADGFLDLYRMVASEVMATVRANLMAHDNLLVVGHSLGGALATFAALDCATYIREPSVMTFASPRVGFHGFAATFNKSIETCWRITNFLDVVPEVPLPPYAHIGTHVAVNGGGSLFTRHFLPAYAAGLTKG
jgi:triacylglycerol lipase